MLACHYEFTTMHEQDNPIFFPPDPPLFSLDLGENGGSLAPTSTSELCRWVAVESSFWAWVRNASISPGNHKEPVSQAVNRLSEAEFHAGRASQLNQSPEEFKNTLNTIVSLLKEVFVLKGLPTSYSPLGKRIDGIRSRSEFEAFGYLFMLMPNTHYIFDARDKDSFVGLIAGAVDKFSIFGHHSEGLEAAKKALEQTQVSYQITLNTKQLALDELHRQLHESKQDLETTAEKERTEFAALMGKWSGEHAAALGNHQGVMKNLQESFREEMSIRAPVEYWAEKQKRHIVLAYKLMRLTFGGIFLVGAALCILAYEIAGSLGINEVPKAWQATVFILVAVLGIWAIRIIIRLYLSNMHLGADAEERVTMVKTYLSLLEGDKLPTDDDRKLILGALFRPTSDGIVKDEGVPHPALDILTKLGNR